MPKSKPLSAGRFTNYQEEKSIVINFHDTITYMVNSFSFSKREVLEAIMEEKKLSDSFMVLSLHFIKQCSDKWKSDYWDRRDMASVNMCREIVLCPEFARFYESRCGKESGIWELCTSGGVYHKDMLLGVKLIHGGARYYLMESDLFGEDMYHIIVNDYGRCVMTSEDGFNPLHEEMEVKQHSIRAYRKS